MIEAQMLFVLGHRRRIGMLRIWRIVNHDSIDRSPDKYQERVGYFLPVLRKRWTETPEIFDVGTTLVNNE